MSSGYSIRVSDENGEQHTITPDVGDRCTIDELVAALNDASPGCIYWFKCSTDNGLISFDVSPQVINVECDVTFADEEPDEKYESIIHPGVWK